MGKTKKSLKGLELFGTNLSTFNIGVKIDKSNATVIAPSQFTISTNGKKETLNDNDIVTATECYEDVNC